MQQVAPTCHPGGAWVGAPGLWVVPFEGRAAADRVSVYHGLENTSSIINKDTRTDGFWITLLTLTTFLETTNVEKYNSSCIHTP